MFRVREDGTLHVSGRTFGYILTDEVFSNFHLRLDFRWGTAKWAPRLELKRDSGILYHVAPDLPDQVWPPSVECQIQETDTGDFWLIGGETIEVDGVRNEPGNFVNIPKKHLVERPHGEWNRVEVIAYEGSCTHLVNGVVVNHGEGASVTSGRILVQSEGAEVSFRDIELKNL